MKVGDPFQLGRYDLQVAQICADGENDELRLASASCRVSQDGSDLGTLEPERRFYKASQQGTSRGGRAAAA